MSADRFFVSQPLGSRGCAALVDGPEAEHMLRVMRKSTGDEVTLFDGSGREATASIEAVRRNEADLLLIDVTDEPRTPRVYITVAVALPRAGAADDVLKKAIECGASRLIPLTTRRSVHRPEKKTEAQRAERFRRLAVSTMKQCGRNLMPVLSPPMKLSELDLADDEVGIFGSPTAPSSLFDLMRERKGVGERVVIVVGPEGGLDPEEEIALSSRGFLAIRHGPQILRVETAVIALTSWFGAF